MALKLVPAHVNETTEPVDNLGGILSVVLVAALILAINFAPVPEQGRAGARAGGDRAGRARRLRDPPAAREQPAVRPARRRAAGLLGRGGRGHHRVRLADGRRVHQPAVPAERARLLDAGSRAPRSCRRSCSWCSSRRARPSSSSRTAPASRCCAATRRCCSAFGDDAAAVGAEGIPYWKVGLAYAFIGIGVGFAGTPASHSLTGSVPVRRAGMASGTADLQRDLGGAIMQSIFGALLTAGYAAAAAAVDRRRTQQRADHRQRPGRAHEVVRRRGERRRAVPAVRHADHGRGQAGVPRRRPVGVHRRPRRRPARRGARVLHVPQARRGAAAARGVRGRGRRPR